MQKIKLEFQRTDARGKLIQVNTGDWKQLNILHLNRDHSFGGHYHKEKIELFYVLSGKVSVTIEDVKNLKTEIILVKENEGFIILPFMKHTLLALSKSIVVELLSKPYKKEDTYE